MPSARRMKLAILLMAMAFNHGNDVILLVPFRFNSLIEVRPSQAPSLCLSLFV